VRCRRAVTNWISIDGFAQPCGSENYENWQYGQSHQNEETWLTQPNICSCLELEHTLPQNETGTTPRSKPTTLGNGLTTKIMLVLKHDLVCSGSTYIKQISLVKFFWVSFGSFEVKLCAY
jgi:hypothetical protein